MQRLGVLVRAWTRDVVLLGVTLDDHVKLTLLNRRLPRIHADQHRPIWRDVVARPRICSVSRHIGCVHDRFIEVLAPGAECKCLPRRAERIADPSRLLLHLIELRLGHVSIR